MTGQPDEPNLPAPREVAQACLHHAWEEDVEDIGRQLLEIAGDTINAMCDRLERQALHLERAELRK